MWVPFVVPVIGAIAAFLLNRGTRLRRARTAALEDLQLHEKASALFGPDDPMIDQVKAHARNSVQAYSARRAAEAKRPVAWLSRAAVVLTALSLGWVSVTLDLDAPWALVTLGIIGGGVGIGVEAGIERIQIGRALKKLPTKQVGSSPEPA